MGYGGLVISAKAHREMGSQAYSATPVGNGPFQIEAKRGSEIILAKNPDYWRPGLPKLDRVIYRAIPDSTTRLQALGKNEFDFVTHPDPKLQPSTPPGQFVSNKHEADCSRFLEEVKESIRRRSEAGVGWNRRA